MSETRALMSQLFDPQMTTLADFDCFSQVVFEDIEDYKRMKKDPFYKEHLIPDHEVFADTKRSRYHFSHDAFGHTPADTCFQDDYRMD